jgi:hypothetical protein
LLALLGAHHILLVSMIRVKVEDNIINDCRIIKKLNISLSQSIIERGVN